MADLDTERIAAAALRVADELGPDGFTMRAVADELGVTPMALYHHVKDKAALVGLVADAVLDEEPLPPSTGDWREDLWRLSCWLRRITNAHPAVAHLRRRHKVWTKSQLPITERWFGLWLQSGLSFDDAMRAGAASSMAIIGTVEEELLFKEMAFPSEELLGPTPNARVAFQRSPDRDEDFELVVRSVIDGVTARLRGDGGQEVPSSDGIVTSTS